MKDLLIRTMLASQSQEIIEMILPVCVKGTEYEIANDSLYFNCHPWTFAGFISLRAYEQLYRNIIEELTLT